MGMYQPTIEIFEEAAFLYKSPRELLNNMQPKPLICSVTSDEGLIAFYGKQDSWKYRIQKHIKLQYNAGFTNFQLMLYHY